VADTKALAKPLYRKTKREKGEFCIHSPSGLTFTLDCHLGKTHDHRSRGDTTWRAQRAAHPHTQTNKAPHSHTWTPDRTNTKKRRGCQGVKERSRGGHLSRSQTLPARTYRGESATLAPGPLSVRLARGTARPR
jgi:hypothetical protein